MIVGMSIKVLKILQKALIQRTLNMQENLVDSNGLNVMYKRPERTRHRNVHPLKATVGAHSATGLAATRLAIARLKFLRFCHTPGTCGLCSLHCRSSYMDAAQQAAYPQYQQWQAPLLFKLSKTHAHL